MESSADTADDQAAIAALSDAEREVVLDAAVSSVRDRPDSFLMYDDRVQPPAYVVAKAQSYDPNVFFRWNRVLHRWELWRWRGGPAEAPKRAPRAHEIGTRAVFCYVIRNQDRSYRPLGEYILSWMRAGDPWRVYSHDTKEAIRRLDEEAIIEDLQDEKDISTCAEDWAKDNKRQIAEYFGSTSPIFIMPGRKEAA